MIKNVLAGLFSLSIISTSLIGTAYAADDLLSSLIVRINTQSKSTDGILPLENRLLGRASWEIKCQYRTSDDVKACVMNKGSISVLHLNNQYIVNIGENHQKDSTTFIRVDQGDSLQEREGLFRNANSLIGQLKRGNYAYTRFQPNKGQYIDSKVSLLGFTDAFNDMEAQFSKLGNDKSTSF